MKWVIQISESSSYTLHLYQKLLTATDVVLSPGPMESSKGVSGLLGAVENSILLIGPQLKVNTTKMDTNEMGNTLYSEDSQFNSFHDDKSLRH